MKRKFLLRHFLLGGIIGLLVLPFFVSQTSAQSRLSEISQLFKTALNITYKPPRPTRIPVPTRWSFYPRRTPTPTLTPTLKPTNTPTPTYTPTPSLTPTSTPTPDLTPLEVQFSIVDDISFDKGTAQANKPIKSCTYGSSLMGCTTPLNANITSTLCQTSELFGQQLYWMKVVSYSDEIQSIFFYDSPQSHCLIP